MRRGVAEPCGAVGMVGEGSPRASDILKMDFLGSPRTFDASEMVGEGSPRIFHVLAMVGEGSPGD